MHCSVLKIFLRLELLFVAYLPIATARGVTSTRMPTLPTTAIEQPTCATGTRLDLPDFLVPPDAPVSISWTRGFIGPNEFEPTVSVEYTFVYFVTSVSVASTPAGTGPLATYPYVYTNTGVTRIFETYTSLFPDGCVSTAFVGSTTVVVRTTFTAFESAATHMAAAATGAPAVPPCPGPEQDEFEPDRRCIARGMDTACIGQCPQNDDGLFICREDVYTGPIGLEMGLGRVCWMENDTALALYEPCRKGDHWVGCMPGKGVVEPYFPWIWL